MTPTPPAAGTGWGPPRCLTARASAAPAAPLRSDCLPPDLCFIASITVQSPAWAYSHLQVWDDTLGSSKQRTSAPSLPLSLPPRCFRLLPIFAARPPLQLLLAACCLCLTADAIIVCSKVTTACNSCVMASYVLLCAQLLCATAPAECRRTNLNSGPQHGAGGLTSTAASSPTLAPSSQDPPPPPPNASSLIPSGVG